MKNTFTNSDFKRLQNNVKGIKEVVKVKRAKTNRKINSPDQLNYEYTLRTEVLNEGKEVNYYFDLKP